MGKVGWTVLLVALAAAGGLFVWAFWKSKQPGSSGGIFSQITGLFSGAANLTDTVTERSIGTGSKLAGAAEDAGHAIGSDVSDVAHGGNDIVSDTVDTIAHIGSKALPWNW